MTQFRFVAPVVAALAMVLASADLAMAQPGRGGRGGPGGGGFNRGMGGIGFLLMSEAVHKELSLQQEQLDELEAMRDKIRDDMRERMRGQFEGMRDMSREERQEAMQKAREQMREFQTDVEKRISGVLTESQMKRLRQINVQQQYSRGGTRGLLRGDLAEKLGITDEQREQMREKAEQEQTKLQQQIQKLQEDARERVLAVLTDSQRAQLKELMGEKFDMPQPNFNRGGRNRGGRNRGNRGGRPGRGGGQGGRPELE